ncbi:MAG: M6 family metalloprotease domain-containing protein, partial [Elusimicrobia bacterium]|nr:M6 family metalloprotease domain-containing protein [Elusimicrobiota bacterium]
MKRLVQILFCILLFRSSLFAVSAHTDTIVIEQPDGTLVKTRIQGDEWLNWLETEDKYPVFYNTKTKFCEYVRVDSLGFQPTGKIVGRDTPVGIRKTSVSDVQNAIQELGQRIRIQQVPAIQESAAPQTGTQKVLVLLIQFADRSLSTTESDWASRFFASSNSVKSFYSEISYNQLILQPAEETSGIANNGVMIVTLPYNHPNTGSNFSSDNQKIVKDAILAADPAINFASFDSNHDGQLVESELHVVAIPAGYERAYSLQTPSVWGHRWSIFYYTPPTVDGTIVGGLPSGYSQFGELHGNHQATVGIIVHELGHDLGLPDLYDGSGPASGVSTWDVMANGSWNGITYAGDTPSQMSAWCKYYLGWVTPYQVTSSSSNMIFPQVETGTGNDRGIKQLLKNPNGPEMNGTGEYFL